MKNMTRSNSLRILAFAAAVSIGMAACGGEDAVEVANNPAEASFKPSDDAYSGAVAKPGSPYSVSYRIIGTPIVGSPVTVDLRVKSSQGPLPLILDYRINDATSMLFAESQPASVRMDAANQSEFQQQVTIIPQREGRFYLNVSASLETEDGTISTVTAIPIQVGTGSRELQPHGEVQTDENGEAVRVLSNDP
jgi:hypothetical protein